MKEPVVVDSTCLISLHRIDQIRLIPELFEPILAPPAVCREFGETPDWLHVSEPSEPSAVSALKLVLDEGEAEAIALAQKARHRVVLDDRKARSVASDLGLRLTGTVGILLRAKRHGLIPAILPLIQDLEENGFYLSQALRTEALALAGEQE